MNAFVVFGILMIAICPVYGAISCTSQALPAAIEAEVTDPEFTFDFDVVPTDWNGTLSLNFTAGPLVITLQGSELCSVFNDFSLNDNAWNMEGGWYPNGSAVGYFLGLNSDNDVICEIIFSEAIAKFSIRVASALSAGLFAYDEADQELNCDFIPYVTAPKKNAFAVRGFSSTTRNIKKIVIKDSYATADLISFGRCPEGQGFKNEQCLNITCATFGDDLQCSADATCLELKSYPYISCTCNEGFTGSGIGQDGCVAIPLQSPVSSPVSRPVAAPSLSPVSSPISSPISRPVSSPKAKLSGSDKVVRLTSTMMGLLLILV